jgi:hypothetical protein
MLTTLDIIGMVALGVVVLGVGFLIQRLDSALSPDADGPKDVTAEQPPATSRVAERKHRRR